jgi:phosphohistidine swiveling domain-containing protein
MPRQPISIVFATLTLCGVAVAIPTPDVFISLFQFGHFLFAFLVSSAVGVRWRILKMPFINRSFLAGAACALILAGGLFAFHTASETTNRNVSLYLRSDLNLDAMEQGSFRQYDRWVDEGILTVPKHNTDIYALVLRENPVMVSTHHSQLSYFSGFPTVATPDGPRFFDFAYPGELADYLKNLLNQNPANSQRPVILYGLFKYFPEGQSEKLKSVLMEFKKVYSISYYPGEYFADLGNGRVPVRRSWGTFEYPVREELFIFNQQSIAIPNMFRLLSPSRCSELLADPSVHVLFPYSSSYRPTQLAQFYMDSLLGLYPKIQERLHPIDFYSPQIRQRLKQLSVSLAGKRVLVAGMTKHDWVYLGQDAAFQMVKYEKSTAYLGGCPWVADAAALQFQKNARLAQGQKLGGAFKKYARGVVSEVGLFIGSLESKYGISKWLWIAVTGLLLRFALQPLLGIYWAVADTARHLENKIHFGPWASRLPYRRFLLRTASAFARVSAFIPIAAGVVSILGFQFFSQIDFQPAPREMLVCLVGAVMLQVFASGVSQIFFKSACVAAIAIWLLNATSAWPRGGIAFACGYVLIAAVLERLLRNRKPILLHTESTLFRQGPLSSVVPLSQIENTNQVAAKARSLGILARHPLASNRLGRGRLFSIADGWLVAGPTEAFTPAILGKGQLYVVRSCSFSEDGQTHSQAGRFLSLLDISPQEVPTAIETVRSSMPMGSQVLVQRQITTSLSGVLFTTAVDNPHVAQIEFHRGSCASLVQGKVTPQQVRIGKISGEAADWGTETSDLEQNVLCRLFAIGELVEKTFGQPQDIEWGYEESSGKIYLFQSRNVTRHWGDTAHEQTDLLKVATQSTHLRWASPHTPIFESVSIDEANESPSRLCWSLYRRIYSAEGAMGSALRELGVKSPQSGLVLVQGTFFQFISRPFYRPRFLFLRHCRKLQSELQKVETRFQNGSLASGDDVESNLRRVLELKSLWLEVCLPLLFQCRFLCQQVRDPGPLHNRYRELIADLAALGKRLKLEQSTEKALVAEFQKKWGHRGQYEYELGAAVYRTSPDQVRADALLWAESSPPQNADAHRPLHPFVLREYSKDVSLKILDRLRAELEELARRLDCSSEQLCRAPIEWFERDRKDCSPKALREEILAFPPVPRNLRPIKETLSLFDIEQGNLFVSQARSTEHRECKMIGAPQGFFGPTTRIKSSEISPALAESLPKDTVLIVDYLDPRLASCFGKVAGIVSLVGGGLSHLAILAREEGIPIAVVHKGFQVPADATLIVVRSDGRYEFRTEKSRAA